MSTAPEDRLRENLNRCLSDSLVKGFGGLVIGSVVTLLFFRRRIWPVWLGTGFGVGMAYRGCEKELNEVTFDPQK
ncbi:MICOS complex subunit Mic10 [Drosophila takahashii]|uniref:MICOS complex subunit Mic10 n=1 Tax=Drosophila takahashii TaxID=29030 RepID=UPI0007E66573|nr:MICOS complex subunit Mic10 [Drosophila takahashii]